MSSRHVNQPNIAKLLLSMLLFALSFASVAQAEEKPALDAIKFIKVLEFGKQMKVRGVALSEGVYFGQAKVAGEYGVGLVVDRKTYAWGFNNKGISIQKRF